MAENIRNIVTRSALDAALTVVGGSLDGKVPSASADNTRISSAAKIQIRGGDDAEIVGRDVKIGARGDSGPYGTTTGKVYITNKGVGEDDSLYATGASVTIESATTARVVADSTVFVDSLNDDVRLSGQDVTIMANGNPNPTDGDGTGHIVIANTAVSDDDKRGNSLLLKSKSAAVLKSEGSIRLNTPNAVNIEGGNMRIATAGTYAGGNMEIVSAQGIQMDSEKSVSVKSAAKIAMNATRVDIDLPTGVGNATDRAFYAKQATNGAEVKLRGCAGQSVTVSPSGVSIEGNTAFAGDVDFTDARVTMPQKLDTNMRGWTDGVAPLDAQRMVPMKHLPARTYVSKFDGEADIASVAAMSATEAEAIVFNTRTNRFVARLAEGTYCNNWADSSEYGSPATEGITPEEGKLYLNRSTNNAHLWTGEALVTVNASFDDYLAKLGVTRNQKTGLYSLNGLSDITYEQMCLIVAAGRPCATNLDSYFAYVTTIRTHLPIIPNDTATQRESIFRNCTGLESVSMGDTYPGAFAFYACRNLKRVSCKGVQHTNAGTFRGCTSLETLVFTDSLQANLWLGSSSRLSNDAFRLILARRTSTTPAITLTVSPTVYAYLNDESNLNWHPLLAEAESKGIQIVST